jgi:hypothetical protein
LNQGTSIGAADSLQFWDPVGITYDRYFVHSGKGPGNAAKAGKWVDNDTGDIATRAISPDESFFFSNSGSATNVIIAGDVVVAETGTNTLSIVEGFNLVANPFTVEWELNSTNPATAIDWIDQGAAAGTSIGAADSIQLWDPSGLSYDRYFLHSGKGPGNAAKTGKWVDNDTGDIADVTVAIDGGFFYSRLSGSETFNIVQPYSLD